MKAIRKCLNDDRTRLFYERRPEAYAEATRGRGLTGSLRDFAARIPARGLVLDLGCGAGHDLESFRKQGILAIGLDYAAPMARIAETASGSPVVVADMRAIPFADAQYDGVWASASLLHLPRTELPLALGEIRRVLKPGGLLFASLKTGNGDFSDADGRLFTFYDVDTFLDALMKERFEPIVTDFNDGTAEGSRGGLEKWMTSLSESAR